MASLRRDRAPAQGPAPSMGARAQSPQQGFLTPHMTLLAPEKQRRRELALVTEVPFPFLLCTPSRLAPPRFLPTAREGKCRWGWSFLQSCGSCAGTHPSSASLLGPGLGKTQQTEIGTTQNSQLPLLVPVSHDKFQDQRLKRPEERETEMAEMFLQRGFWTLKGRQAGAVHFEQIQNVSWWFS